MKYKQYNNLSYISFQIVPMCNYTLLSATVKVVETFLEDIWWSLFRSSVPFLMKSVVSQKRPLFIADFGRGNIKNQLDPGQESMGDVPVLSH